VLLPEPPDAAPELLPVPKLLESLLEDEPRLPVLPLGVELPAPEEELPIPEDEPLEDPPAEPPEEPAPEDDLELPIPEDEVPDEPPMPELATSTPNALAVFSSMRPVACKLFDFWNSRIACWVFGPRTPSSGPGSIPLLFSADWTSFTLSLDSRWPADARRLEAAPPVLSLLLCISVLEPLEPLLALEPLAPVPRLLLPVPVASEEDFCEDEPAPLEPLV
jgi:hypothetical protein